ncbi:hypothetical protein [Glycomyces sp. YM15]|uniref:hypothetical protein n=1 Tax=Glycomyces sp. YM15 TaxID=2800446 RepID=UPI0019639C05|nr:hypothetical protein [Glycomyces sp. YM15]
MADDDFHISLDELRAKFTAPSAETISAFWSPHAAAEDASGPDSYPAQVEGVGAGWVFVDVEHDRLWLGFFDNENPTVQAQNRLFRIDPDADVDESAAIRALFPDVVVSHDVFDVPTLMLVRSLSKRETANLLDQLDLDAAGKLRMDLDLPSSFDAAFLPYFIQHGWTPQDLEDVAWSVTSDEDAAALAAHPRQWWRERGWLPFGFDVHGDVHPPARHLPDLIVAGVRPEVAIAAFGAGMEDLAAIAALRPPVIPGEATRVVISDHDGRMGTLTRWSTAFTDAQSAQAALDEHPQWWLMTIAAATDPGLHVFHADRRWTAWSDGLLTGPLYGADEESVAARSTLVNVEGLMAEVLRSEGRDDLDGSALWVQWADATGSETTVEAERTATRQVQVAPDVTVAVVDSLVRHTIVKPGRSRIEAWQIRTDYETRYTIPFVGRQRGATRFFDSADAATAAWAAGERSLPAVMTINEIAEHVGSSKDAFARAFRRAWDAAPLGMPRPVIETEDRRRWFDPVPVLAWDKSRPGHGPGRGHRRRR